MANPGEEIGPSPSNQARLERFFQSPKKVADSEIKLQVLATSPEVSVADRQDSMWQKICEETDRPFIKMGREIGWEVFART